MIAIFLLTFLALFTPLDAMDRNTTDCFLWAQYVNLYQVDSCEVKERTIAYRYIYDHPSKHISDIFSLITPYDKAMHSIKVRYDANQLYLAISEMDSDGCINLYASSKPIISTMNNVWTDVWVSVPDEKNNLGGTDMRGGPNVDEQQYTWSYRYSKPSYQCEATWDTAEGIAKLMNAP